MLVLHLFQVNDQHPYNYIQSPSYKCTQNHIARSNPFPLVCLEINIKYYATHHFDGHQSHIYYAMYVRQVDYIIYIYIAFLVERAIYARVNPFGNMCRSNDFERPPCPIVYIYIIYFTI